MKKQKDIGQFFKKRLIEAKPPEEEWNIPDEALWDSAKPHFPKKKKRRTPFFLLIFFTLIVGGAIGFMIASNNNRTTAKSVSISSKEQSASNKSKENNTSDVEKNNSEHMPASASLDKEAGNKGKHDVSATPNTNAKTEVKLDISEATETMANDNKEQAIKTEKNISGQSGPGSLKLVNTPIPAPQTEGKSESSTENNVSDDHNYIKQTRSEPETQDKREDDGHKLNEKTNYVLPMPLLNSASIQNFEQESPSFRLSGQKPPTIPKYSQKAPYKAMPRWEIGLSHAPFVSNPFNLANSDEELNENESYYLNSIYDNVNIYINHGLNRKMSLTSGLMYSKLKIQLDFTDAELYESSSSTDDLAARISNSIHAGSLFINDKKSDVNITFKPGVILQAGDTLAYAGMVPIKIDGIQIPFLFNYHLSRGKFEWVTTAGFSIDMFNIAIDEVAIDVFRKQELISEEVNFNTLSVRESEFTLYLGGGLKYHIGRHINLGAAVRLDLAALVFSRYDFGVYYSF